LPDRRRPPQLVVTLVGPQRGTHDRETIRCVSHRIFLRQKRPTGPAGYRTIDPVAETLYVQRDWNAPGVQTLAGTLPLRAYGSFIDSLKRGEFISINDVDLDERTASAADALKGVVLTLIAASSPTHFIEDTPTAILVRQVLGAIAEFEKTTTVAKLAAARRRKRIATGAKVEGRKSHAEERPEVVALAKALGRKKPKGGQLSLRAISAELEARGFLNERGQPFHHKSVAAMLAGKRA
jgi:hypothetical protein